MSFVNAPCRHCYDFLENYASNEKCLVGPTHWQAVSDDRLRRAMLDEHVSAEEMTKPSFGFVGWDTYPENRSRYALTDYFVLNLDTLRDTPEDLWEIGPTHGTRGDD